MESASLEGVCERLKQEVAAELVTGPGKRWRCPAGLKSRIVSYGRVCREQGEPLLDISNRLGLVESTLARWLRTDSKELAAGFRPVSIVAAEEHHQGDTISGTLRLTTPAGYRIDGLDAQTLAFLLRVVG